VLAVAVVCPRRALPPADLVVLEVKMREVYAKIEILDGADPVLVQVQAREADAPVEVLDDVELLVREVDVGEPLEKLVVGLLLAPPLRKSNDTSPSEALLSKQVRELQRCDGKACLAFVSLSLVLLGGEKTSWWRVVQVSRDSGGQNLVSGISHLRRAAGYHLHCDLRHPLCYYLSLSLFWSLSTPPPRRPSPAVDTEIGLMAVLLFV
jgi:hypothetical protein